MRMTSKPTLFLTAACMLIMLTSGCGTLMYFFFPAYQTITIEAEFDGLKNKTVAVVVFADENTLFSHATAPLLLSSEISIKLRKSVEGLTAINAQEIAAYQSKNIAWVEMDRTKLGKVLKADFVLHISLVEFSTVEEGYIDSLKGTINGEVKLYDCSLPEDDACVWKGQNIRIQHPKTPTVRTRANEISIHNTIIEKFSDKLAKKFYTHTKLRDDRGDL
ncbi:MAG: hypothetical protein HN350_07040 [Phycisphaerales bacterium]|jgi:hypothetical protein|nr:hypothetical protein [Phycisphaerales bacterium]